ncbi:MULTISPECIES: hypothetical protein [unclassified Sphingopyxis]|uniref:hypothetical protein n=1 Tax=unclassified Sphingopyxis TaxID=2614943 RepID=UPI0007378C9E|nr:MULTISPECIES: hypothetical protein [unclassified Sphingopyxis]KTE35356.1 hypothetical protein ATE62_15420 [Sphingopyxis sp. HIX]KTE84045.1 hypothetical protein ATE72_10725 [Sphingopyxis sp. HXXIV]
MTHRHFGMTGSARAVLAFALAAGLTMPVGAQEAETPAPAPPRSIDFRLPPAAENDGRAPGVQGPSNNGIAPTGPNDTRPTPAPTPAPPRVAPTQPQVQPQPAAPTTTRPAATPATPRDPAAAAPRAAAPTDDAASTDTLPTASDAAPGLSLPSATTTSDPLADDASVVDAAAAAPAPDRGMPVWTWLLALLAAAGAGYWYWRRRPVVADGPSVEPVPQAPPPPRPVPAPQPTPRAVTPPPAPQPQPVAPARQPVLEGAVAGQRAPSPLVTRPAAERRAIVSIALDVVSIRMTPEHVVVGFALDLANQGSADATGLMVRIALNQGSAMPEPVLARFFDGAGGSVLRDDMEIKVGAGESLTTEAMLPRAIVEPLMIGGKPMLVPVMAFDVTYHWESDDPDAFGQNAGSFVLGREQGASGSEKLAPLPLDRPSYAVDRPGSRATAVRRTQ